MLEERLSRLLLELPASVENSQRRIADAARPRGGWLRVHCESSRSVCSRGGVTRGLLFVMSMPISCGG